MSLIVLATPTAELTTEPRALKPAKIGINGTTPPLTGSFITLVGVIFLPFFDFFTETNAALMAELIDVGFDFFIATLAVFIKVMREIVFGFEVRRFLLLLFFRRMRPDPSLVIAVLAFVAADTASAVALSPKLESVAKTRFNASEPNFLSA